MHDVLAEMNQFYREIASKSKAGGWRAVGAKIGKSGTYARQVALGKRPLTEEIAVSWMLSNGWEPKRYSFPPCPGCGGEPHVAKEGCNGQPVVHVAVLAPGQRVTTQRKQRQPSPEVQAMVRGLLTALERKQAQPATGPRCYDRKGRLACGVR